MIRTSASISIQYDSIFSPFPAKEFKNGFQWAKESGFDAVEIILSDPLLLNAKTIVRASEEFSIPVSTISTGQAMALEGLSMISPNRNVRQLTYERMCAAIDFSSALGTTPNVTVGLIRGATSSMQYTDAYDLLKREFSRVVEYAAKKAVVLNFEPLNRYECTYINTCMEAIAFFNDIGNPVNVGILYDTFHSNIEDDDMLKTIEMIAPKISNVHMADSNRHLPGEGHLDFERLMRVLNQSGYAGYVTLEVLNRPSAQHIIDNAKICVQAIKSREA